MNLKKIEADIDNLLEPIRKNGFGKVKSVEGARRKLKKLFTLFIRDYLEEICEHEFILIVEIRLKNFNKRGWEKVGARALIDKNDMIHLFALEIDKGWLERAYLGDKNIRTRLIQLLARATIHELLHMHQFENCKIPVNYLTLDKDNIIKKGATSRIRYYSDKSEISAFALNTAQELFRSFNDIDTIKQMLCQTSNYATLKRRSASFWRYHFNIRSNFGEYPKTKEIWQRYLKRLMWFLDELYG